MEEQELYLTEVLSLCVRKGKALLITALMFAVLLGGWQLRKQIKAANDSENSEEKIEERYQVAMLEYEKKKSELERSIEDNEKALADMQEYLDNSLLMKIDPYNKYETSIYFGFSDIDEAAWNQVHYSNTSLDFVYSKIRSQYVVYWNSMELPTDLHVSGYSGVQDKYMREVLSVSNQDGGMLCITAVGSSAAESEKLADALYQAFTDVQPTAARNSYGHSFVLLKRITKATIDTGLESSQKSNQNAVEDYQLSIEDLKAQLEELDEPSREQGYSRSTIIKNTVKYGVLGAVAGIVVACFGVLLWAVMANVLISSQQVERQLGITCLGAVKEKPGVFDRWADKLGGERRWKDPEQAVSYAVRKLETTAAPESKLLLATTLREGKRGSAAEALKKGLSERGYKVNCIYDAIHDPAFMDAVKDSDSVVLFETQGVSRLTNAIDVLKLNKAMEKPTQGFVLV